MFLHEITPSHRRRLTRGGVGVWGVMVSAGQGAFGPARTVVDDDAGAVKSRIVPA
jgi:hypothetical protein